MPGGQGGAPFEDSTTTKALRRIDIWYGDKVNAIVCSYDDNIKASRHGSDTGQWDFFALSEDEAIIIISVWVGTASDSIVDAIQFQTSAGRKSPKYGGSGDQPFVLSGDTGSAQRPLMGFRWRSGSMIDAIEPVWSDTMTLGAKYVQIDKTSHGGSGGNAFDMLDAIQRPFELALMAVVIRHGQYIDSIECQFRGLPGSTTGDSSKSNSSTGEIDTAPQGGKGGDELTFTLAEGEIITRIEGRAGEYVDRLQFTTSMNRKSPIFGGDGGEPFLWVAPNAHADAVTDIQCGLLCFQGRANELVDSLTPVWAPNPPKKFTLVLDPFDDAELQSKGNIEKSHQYTQVADNLNSKHPVEHEFEIKVTKSIASTVTLSNSSRTTLGGKVGLEIGTESEAGVPFIGQAKVTTKLSVEVSTEHEWGSQTTDGTEKTTSFEDTVRETVKIDPGKRMTITAAMITATCKDVIWTGTMTVLYASGVSKKFPVSGTMDSVSSITCHTSTKQSPVPKNI